MRWTHSLTILMLSGMVLAGCIGTGGTPSEPPLAGKDVAAGESSVNRTTWGLYDVALDTERGTIEAVPLRTAMMRVNVNHLMELSGPKHLKFENMDLSEFLTQGRIQLDVGLEHPFPGLDQYTGFDVYGVFMHNGSGSLSYDGLSYPVAGEDAVLMNADGYTRWFNMPEFTALNIFGYTPGVAGTSGFGPTATLNGYRVFGDELDKNEDLFDFLGGSVDFSNRLMFRPGSTNWRHYDLRFPMVGGNPVLRFQYAVHASWNPPDPSPPLQIPEDFPLNANMHEANLLSCVADDTPWFEGPGDWGGDLVLSIDIFDWQGALENPSGIPGEIGDIKVAGNFIPATWSGGWSVVGGDSHYSTVQVEVPEANLNLTSAEGNECWVIVESASPSDYADDGLIPPGKYPGSATLAAFARVSVPVGPNPQQGIHLTDVTPPGWPAILQDVWVEGDLAYAVGYAGLIIFDVSGPGDPVYVGGYTLWGAGNEVQVKDGWCYIADGQAGLRVLDVTDPSDPVDVGLYVGTSAEGVFVTDDGYCYLADGKGGLKILDVGGGTQGGSPGNPKLEGQLPVGYAAVDVFVDKGLAHVIDQETSFLIVDVGGGSQGGSPSNPVLEASLPTINNGKEVFVSGNYAYVGDNQTPDCVIRTVDVSMPSSPAIVDTDNVSDNIEDVWVDSGCLYAAADQAGLGIFSLSNPANPVYLAGYDMPGNAAGVFAAGVSAYVTTYYWGLEKFDVSSPTQPEFVGRYYTPHNPYNADVDGGYVYLADDGTGLEVVDIGGGGADPEQPLMVARWTTCRDGRGVFVEDGYAYLGGGWYGDGDLYIVDVGASLGSPTNPVGVGYYASDCTYGLQKMGAYLYAASYESGLKIYDVDGGALGGSPSNPKFVTSYSTNTAWEVWAENGYVYLADGHNLGSNLYVFDVGGGTGSPTSPIVADQYETSPSHVYDVNVIDGYAYCAVGNAGLGSGLRVFDVGASIGAPDDIQFVGEYETDQMARGLCAAYGYAFVVCSDGKMYALDVGAGFYGGSPDNPMPADQISLHGDLFSAMVDGQYAYVSSHTGGLRIIRLWD